MRELLLVAVVALTVGVSPANAEPNFERLSAEMAAHCSDQTFSGVITVMIGDTVAFQRACGEGVTPESRFKIFSTSKLLTAFAVMSLTEDGLMAVDAPISAYIPDLPPAWRAVTVRSLLNHTSGLPDATNALLEAFSTTHADAMRAVLASLHDAQAPDTAPGQTWRYNNFGYELLADAAAHAAGMSFDRVLHDRVFDPARMDRAEVELARLNDDGETVAVPDVELVTGFNRDEDGLHEARSYSFVQLGAGAVHATAGDFVALTHAIRKHQIVGADTWRAMTDQAVANAPSVPSARYGLGVMSVERSGLRFLGHTGGTNGYISSWRQIPERDAAVFSLSNYGWSETRWIEEAVAAALASSD